ncbi:MAG: hypothetical protein MJ153_07380, partial [Clostridia bacterium]|nr:hypothetical protein [Clostridia bacterium]
MKHLKKVLALTLCASVVMCSACSIDELKDKLSGKGWKKEAAEVMPDSFEAADYGKVYLCGKTYSFPFKVSELLDNGWTYSTDFTNLDSELLEPKYFITEWFDLIAPNNESKVSIMCFNDGEEEALLKDCYVSSLKVDYVDINEAMFAGDIAISDIFKTKEDASKAFNLDKMTLDEASSGGRQDVYYSEFVSNDVDCEVKVYIADTGSNSFYINRVEYEALSYSSFTPLEYITACLEGLVKYDRTNFDMMDDDYEGFYDYYNPYLIESVVYYAGFECTDKLTEEQCEKINDFLKKLSSGIEFEVRQEDSNVYIDYVCPNLNELIEIASTNASDKYIEDTGNDITMELLNDTEFMAYFIDSFCTLSSEIKYMPEDTIVYPYDEELGIDPDSFVDALFTLYGYYSDIEGETE